MVTQSVMMSLQENGKVSVLWSILYHFNILVQRGGSQWCYGKGFDTFSPLGPALISPSVPQT